MILICICVILNSFFLLINSADNERNIKTLESLVLEHIVDHSEYNLDTFPWHLKDKIIFKRAEQKIAAMSSERHLFHMHNKALDILKTLAECSAFGRLKINIKSHCFSALLLQLLKTKKLNYDQKITVLNTCCVRKGTLKDASHAHLLAHAIFDDQTIIPALLFFGADPTQAVTCIENHKSQSPFHIAARVGAKKVIKMFLAHKADPNVTNYAHATPLHYAVLFDKRDIVQLLINAGARLECQDDIGRTPLMLATPYPHLSSFLKEAQKTLGKRSVVGRNEFGGDLLEQNKRRRR